MTIRLVILAVNLSTGTQIKLLKVFKSGFKQIALWLCPLLAENEIIM